MELRHLLSPKGQLMKNPPLRRFLSCTAWVVALAGMNVNAFADNDEVSMVSNVQAQPAGLTVQWFTQLSTSNGSLVNTEIVVDENQATTYFELSGGGLREVISDKDISPFGKPFGIVGAEEYAKVRQEVMQAQLKFDNITEEIKIERYSVPKVTIYAATGNGVIHCIDGESGLLRWKTEIGSRRFQTVGLGASKKYVAAVNGSRVYCLDAENGKVLFEYQCHDAVLAPPAVSEEMVFVPLAGGALQALPIKTKAFGTLPMNSTGTANNRPIVSGNFVAWTTDVGNLFVAPKDAVGSMRYRIKANGEFASPPIANTGRVFAVTLGGFIYAIDDKSGSILWSFSLGERVTKAPVAIGNYLLVISDEDHLFKFHAKTGDAAPGWEKPLNGVTGYAGASDSRFYLKDNIGNIIVVDRESGARLGSVDSKTQFTPIVNEMTDRIYLCTNSGLLECLREIGRPRPMFHGDFLEEVVATPDDKAEEADKQSDTEMEAENPFGGVTQPAETNPFGGSTKPADDNNPFGGSGGGDKPKADDSNPFGSSGGTDNNPFGGG